MRRIELSIFGRQVTQLIVENKLIDLNPFQRKFVRVGKVLAASTSWSKLKLIQTDFLKLISEGIASHNICNPIKRLSRRAGGFLSIVRI